MNKILKKVHSYNIFYSESDNRWHTYIVDETKDINKVAFDDFSEKPNCVPLAVLLTFQTGLRLGEIVALKWDDIDYESKTLRVCRFERVQQDYTDDFENLTSCEHIIVECDTKGEFGERFVDLTDDALYILQLLRACGLSFEKIREEVGHKSVLTTANHYLYDTQEDAENRRLINLGLNIRTI